ncbi:retrovirus-related pol polyprotein from transposon TNT 1-94 [Tanacetum coccineum]
MRKDFQDSPDDEEDTRSSQEYLNDLEEEYQERALLTNSGTSSKSSMVKNKGLVAEAYEWDEEDVSSNDNDMTEVKVLMALANDENFVVGKESARNGEWMKNSMRKLHTLLDMEDNDERKCFLDYLYLVFVKSSADDTKVSIPGVERPWLSKAEGFTLLNHDTRRILPAESQVKITDPSVAIIDSSATKYDSADKSSVCSTLLPSLEKLAGAEPISGPKTIKSILKSKLTFKPKTLKGVIINEPSSAPAKGNKNVLASKRNSAPTSDIRKPIWYLNSGCSRHMTGVKSYLHKYVEQPGPKMVFGDDSASITERYGSIKWKFDEKADDGYFLGYSLVSKAFRVFNTRRQQTKETYHITFDENTDAIKFTKPSDDNITIVKSERYLPDEYFHPYEPSQRYQILNDDQSEHSNHNNDNHIIDDLPKTKDVQTSEPLSSPTEDASVSNTNPVLTNHSLSIPSMASTAPQEKWSHDKHIELVNIIGNPGARMLTRAMPKELSVASAHECLFVDFLFEEEPKKISEALKHPGWVNAMQEELNQFYKNKVWNFVPALYEKTVIGSKWVFRNKREETANV